MTKQKDATLEYLMNVMAIIGIIFFVITLISYNSVVWQICFGMTLMAIIALFVWIIQKTLIRYNINFLERILIKNGGE